MIAGALPIGAAWKSSEDSKNNIYHISPQKLAEYEGYKKEDILELIEEYKKGNIALAAQPERGIYGKGGQRSGKFT